MDYDIKEKNSTDIRGKQTTQIYEQRKYNIYLTL